LRKPASANPGAAASRLTTLTAELMTAASPDTLDRTLRHAVEFARTVIELERAAIYLLDDKNHAMVGTYGTDAQGNTIDEHALTYQYGDLDRQAFARAVASLP